MRKKLKTIIAYNFIIFTFISISAKAHDYLEPETQPYAEQFSTEYHGMVIKAFKDSYSRDVKARALVMPSFKPEFIVYINEDSGKYYINKLSPEKMLWGYMVIKDMKRGRSRIIKDGELVKDEDGIKKLESMYPGNFNDMPIKQCKVQIDNALANSIIEIWEGMLMDTRYTIKPNTGLERLSDRLCK